MENAYLFGGIEIFTFFFIMLGPLKLLGPFAQEAKALPDAEVHKIALQAFLLSAIALIVCGYIGKSLLINWNIPVPVLALTSGLIFFYIAFMMIVKPKKEERPTNPQQPRPTGLGAALSLIVTPYGAATLIGLLAIAEGDMKRELVIFAALIGVLLFDFLAMFFIHRIMNKVVMLIMQLLGVVLGVLQAALALNMIYASLKMLYP